MLAGLIPYCNFQEPVFDPPDMLRTMHIRQWVQEYHVKFGDKYFARVLSPRQAAKIADRDHSSLRDAYRAKNLRGNKKNVNGQDCYFFSLNDIADYLLKKARQYKGEEHGYWTLQEIKELEETGQCRGRSRKAVQIKKMRLKNELF